MGKKYEMVLTRMCGRGGSDVELQVSVVMNRGVAIRILSVTFWSQEAYRSNKTQSANPKSV